MIMIVTLVGFTVLLYGMGYFSGITSARDLANAQTIDALQERFVIVDCHFTNTSPSSTTVTVTVYNYGNENIFISGLYANDTPIGTFSPVEIYPNQNNNLPINGTLSQAIQGLGDNVEIRVVTTLGNYYDNWYTS